MEYNTIDIVQPKFNSKPRRILSLQIAHKYISELIFTNFLEF